MEVQIMIFILNCLPFEIRSMVNSEDSQTSANGCYYNEGQWKTTQTRAKPEATSSLYSLTLQPWFT